MKSRFLFYELEKKKTSSLARIIVLTGARQTGKTTIAKQCFPEYEYLSIEDPVLRVNYKKLNTAQWEAFYPKAILDEVQKEPVLIESIKSVYDQYPNVRYLLLGSSQLLLLKKVKESLAGRCVIKEMYPLTLPELLTNSWEETPNRSFFQRFVTDMQIPQLLPSFTMYPDYGKKKGVFDYYLKFGGYPALVNKEFNDDDRFEWLSTYVKTYLERDIRDISEIKDLEPFMKVQRISSLLTGQMVNFSKLGNEADVDSKTAKRFLQYLSISYQAVFVESWQKSKLSRLVKTPKLHFLDPGIQKAIINKKGDLTGNEFESAVIAEIYKQFKAVNYNGNFYHLRNHNGTEIDILIEMEEHYIAIEIKQTNRVSKKDARHFNSLSGVLDKPVLKCFVISNDDNIKDIDKNVIAIPAAMFLT